MASHSDRLRQAEKAGKIKTHLYTYSPAGTTADTRHVVIDLAGREHVIKNHQVAAFLRHIRAIGA
jgi:hypothetical protein